MSTNRYDGTCHKCRTNVPADTGVVYKEYPFTDAQPFLVRCDDDRACLARVRATAAERGAASKDRREADLVAAYESAQRKINDPRTANVLGHGMTERESHAVRVMRQRSCTADVPKTIEFAQPGPAADAAGWRVRYVRRVTKRGVRVRIIEIDPDGTEYADVVCDVDTEAEAIGRTLDRIRSTLMWCKDRESDAYHTMKAFVDEASVAS